MPSRSSQSKSGGTDPNQVEFDLFSTSHQRTFLNWDKQLLETAVDHFTADWTPGTPLDLSSHLVVVPTSHSGRRFREALAIRASEVVPTAVIPPQVVAPEFFISPDRVSGTRFDKPVAARAETLMLWTALILELPLNDYRNLFPVDPVDRTLSWALKTAGDLLRVRSLLGENGLDFGDAARVLGSGEMEPERWEELAELEREVVKMTRHSGFFDAAEARRVAAAEGRIPAEIKKITVIATPDPLPLAVNALARLSQKIPVEVLIYAPESELSSQFDDWGRPAPHEKWLRHHLNIPSPVQTIFSERSPAGQAERATNLATRHRSPDKMVAVGVPDPEIVAPLEKALADHEIGGFDPGGKSLPTHSLYFLIGIMSKLVRGRGFDSFMALLRCPEVNATLRNHLNQEAEEDEGIGLAAVLSSFDELANDHLPESIDDALDALRRKSRRNRAELSEAILWIENLLSRFKKEAFSVVLTDFLGDIYGRRKFQSNKPEDAVFSAIADQINDVLDAFDSPAMKTFSKKLDAGAHFDLLLELLKNQSFQPERAAGDIDLQGWLELLWEDAPHLILTGMNDGKVPEAIIGHAWLPDSARRALGLRHNDARYARDVYMLAAFLESRRSSGGRVDFIFGRVGEGNDPLRPSRLLFQCPDEELPARIAQFFEGHDDDESDAGPVPWELSWRLKPPSPTDELKIFTRLSVTSFRDFLTCPFRFYLRHGLRMKPVEIQKTEMESWEFGTVCHEVLEAFAVDKTMSKSTDVSAIREFFHETIDRLLVQKFGPTWTVPVLIQRRGMGQRLDWWAEIEAEQRAEGWEIIESEMEISPREDHSDEPVFEIAGLKITGSIDRVERHPEHGIRIVDFKTFAGYDASSKGLKSVEDYHLTKLRRDEGPEDFPDWMIASSSKGDERRWSNLQLPLYKLAAAKKYPDQEVTVAYGTIGKAKSEVTLHSWPELEAGILRSAHDCANGVIKSVLAREFWPPAEKVQFDDFQDLFFGDVLAAVDPASLIR